MTIHVSLQYICFILALIGLFVYLTNTPVLPFAHHTIVFSIHIINIYLFLTTSSLGIFSDLLTLRLTPQSGSPQWMWSAWGYHRAFTPKALPVPSLLVCPSFRSALSIDAPRLRNRYADRDSNPVPLHGIREKVAIDTRGFNCCTTACNYDNKCMGIVKFIVSLLKNFFRLQKLPATKLLLETL